MYILKFKFADVLGFTHHQPTPKKRKQEDHLTEVVYWSVSHAVQIQGMGQFAMWFFLLD